MGHRAQHSGSVLQSFCLTSITFGKEMHRVRQQDRILNLWIIFSVMLQDIHFNDKNRHDEEIFATVSEPTS